MKSHWMIELGLAVILVAGGCGMFAKLLMPADEWGCNSTNCIVAWNNKKITQTICAANEAQAKTRAQAGLQEKAKADVAAACGDLACGEIG